MAQPKEAGLMDEGGGNNPFPYVFVGLLSALLVIVVAFAIFGPNDKAESTDSPWSIGTAPTGNCFLIYNIGSAGAGSLNIPVKEIPC